MLQLYFRSKHDKKMKKPNKLMKGSWIYVQAPTEEELDILVQKHGLEQGHLIDALDPYEVPRYEVEDGKKYFFLRFTSLANAKEYTVPLLIVIADDFFVTLCSQPLPILESLIKNVDFCTTQKTKAFVQILLLINKDYKTRINSINKSVKNVGNSLEKIGNTEIAKFVEFERIIDDFLFSLIPSNLILENILYGKTLKLYEEDADLIEDVSLSNGQLIEICKSTLKHIVNTREAYSTIMTNNLNKTMKLLTSMTIILTIPTIFSSFYGMNVLLPMQNNPLMFLWILLFTVGFSILLLFIFFKNKLL